MVPQCHHKVLKSISMYLMDHLLHLIQPVKHQLHNLHSQHHLSQHQPLYLRLLPVSLHLLVSKPLWYRILASAIQPISILRQPTITATTTTAAVIVTVVPVVTHSLIHFLHKHQGILKDSHSLVSSLRVPVQLAQGLDQHL